MVYFNGAEVVDMPAGKVLSSTLVSPEVIDFCVDMARGMDAHFQTYFPANSEHGEILMIEKDRPEAEMYRKHTGLSSVTGDIKAALAQPGVEGCLKGMFVAEIEVQEKIRPLLAKRFGNSIYITRTFPTFLEVLAAGASKGEGLSVALRARGILPEETLALGDEENDLPLFDAAGFSLAPSNAKEIVRQKAGFVCGSNAEEGVALWLEEHIL
jgi:hydroxymethylpyrimidine pyrophosphatase-like HAD family hydrolase